MPHDDLSMHLGRDTPSNLQARVVCRITQVCAVLKTLLAPELIAVEGFQEWAQCRRMEGDCARFTDGHLQRTQAFYISMLALRYRTPRGDKVIWPNQYTWLLQERLIDWADHESWGLSVENISDKSKSDSLAKLIALLQVSWFVAQCIMRAVHSLPLSQLESMTLGYIPLFVVTYFFWWYKAKDIQYPSVIDLPEMSHEQRDTFKSMTVSNKFDDEGMKDQISLWNIWYLTPRVFEKEEEDRSMEEARARAAQKAAKAATERAAKSEKDNTDPEMVRKIAISRSDIQHLETCKSKSEKKELWHTGILISTGRSSGR